MYWTTMLISLIALPGLNTLAIWFIPSEDISEIEAAIHNADDSGTVLVLSNNGRFLAQGDWRNSTLKVFDLGKGTGAESAVPTGERHGATARAASIRLNVGEDIDAFAFSPDERTLAIADGDKIRILELPSGRSIREISAPAPIIESRSLSDNSERLLRVRRPLCFESLAFSEDGKYLAGHGVLRSGPTSDTHHVYLVVAANQDDAKALMLEDDEGPSNESMLLNPRKQIAMSSGGERLAAAVGDKIRLWTLKRGNWDRDCPLEGQPISLRFSRDGRFLAAVTLNQDFRFTAYCIDLTKCEDSRANDLGGDTGWAVVASHGDELQVVKLTWPDKGCKRVDFRGGRLGVLGFLAKGASLKDLTMPLWACCDREGVYAGMAQEKQPIVWRVSPLRESDSFEVSKVSLPNEGS